MITTLADLEAAIGQAKLAGTTLWEPVVIDVDGGRLWIAQRHPASIDATATYGRIVAEVINES